MFSFMWGDTLTDGVTSLFMLQVQNQRKGIWERRRKSRWGAGAGGFCLQGSSYWLKSFWRWERFSNSSVIILSNHTGCRGTGGWARGPQASKPIGANQEEDQLQSAGEGRTEVQHWPGIKGENWKYNSTNATMTYSVTYSLMCDSRVVY